MIKIDRGYIQEVADESTKLLNERLLKLMTMGYTLEDFDDELAYVTDGMRKHFYDTKHSLNKSYFSGVNVIQPLYASDDSMYTLEEVTKDIEDTITQVGKDLLVGHFFKVKVETDEGFDLHFLMDFVQDLDNVGNYKSRFMGLWFELKDLNSINQEITVDLDLGEDLDNIILIIQYTKKDETLFLKNGIYFNIKIAGKSYNHYECMAGKSLITKDGVVC